MEIRSSALGVQARRNRSVKKAFSTDWVFFWFYSVKNTLWIRRRLFGFGAIPINIWNGPRRIRIKESAQMEKCAFVAQYLGSPTAV